MATAIFRDAKPDQSLPENVLRAEKLIRSLAASFRAAAAKAPKSISVFRRVFDEPHWTSSICENVAKSMDIAANALLRKDKYLSWALMFDAKQDFDAEAKKHLKASKYLLVGRSHVQAAKDFRGYSDVAKTALELLV
jgi:hypothetical protein